METADNLCVQLVVFLLYIFIRMTKTEQKYGFYYCRHNDQSALFFLRKHDYSAKRMMVIRSGRTIKSTKFKS